MASERQIAANRRNALLSSGPKTQTGKRASSRNALRHGLTARNNDNLSGEIESRLHPESIGERRLAQSVAGDHSRLTKARSIRNSAGTLTLAAAPHSIQLLSLYERRSHSSSGKISGCLTKCRPPAATSSRPSCSAPTSRTQMGSDLRMTKSPHEVAPAILSPVAFLVEGIYF